MLEPSHDTDTADHRSHDAFGESLLAIQWISRRCTGRILYNNVWGGGDCLHPWNADILNHGSEASFKNLVESLVHERL